MRSSELENGIADRLREIQKQEGREPTLETKVMAKNNLILELVDLSKCSGNDLRGKCIILLKSDAQLYLVNNLRICGDCGLPDKNCCFKSSTILKIWLVNKVALV